ncbi:uncharacterized protein [Drosophila suzukii]|uniref:Uncharacterized protein n=1 Tax=Drosophila suzukii TaxID=28584 RepID=A0AB39ZL19_DROSZ
MAFSTQKEFFHVPFSNETYEFECIDSCVKLKSYPSTIDDRSWSANEDKKSQFVADLVACNSPIKKQRDEDGRPSPRTPSGPEDEYGSSLVVGDSLINAADDTIGRMQDLMIKNNMLQKKLADSDEKLRTANQESDEIKRIMDQRYDPAKSKELKKKIKQLADDNKITPQDEKELNDLQAAIDDMNKAHDILEAENANLKRLIDKQSKRCKLDSIPIEPEKSTDIPYLQKKIDDLGKEVALLRQFEDEVMKRCAKKCGADGGGGSGGGPAGSGGSRGAPGKGSFSPNKDADNIQKILADRDALRKKCKELEELGEKVNQLEQKANEAECLTNNLEDNLQQQCQCMQQLQCEMQEMQNYYENEVDKAKGNEEILKCRCNQMKQELVSAKCAAQRAQCLQMEIDVLRNELRKRDIAINAYDCQYQQLMMKAKMFKSAGYRFLDDLPPDCSESCADCAEEEDEGNGAP